MWSLLRSVGPGKGDLADPHLWWEFRKSEVRRALSHGAPKTAYAIAKAHGPLDGESLSDAEYLAGWVALRFLHDPKRAIPHFEASAVAGLARTETRAAYWLGRARLGAPRPARRACRFHPRRPLLHLPWGAGRRRSA